MSVIEHMMKLYQEGIEELMGAQKYAKQSRHAEDNEERSMYKNMARQELEHAQMLIRDGDRIFSNDNSHDSISMVWKPLRDHLFDWHNSILNSIS